MTSAQQELLELFEETNPTDLLEMSEAVDEATSNNMWIISAHEFLVELRKLRVRHQQESE